MAAYRAVKQITRNIVKNLQRAAWPEPWVDRRGRLRGNYLAMRDLLRGRLRPQKVVSLDTGVCDDDRLLLEERRVALESSRRWRSDTTGARAFRRTFSKRGCSSWSSCSLRAGFRVTPVSNGSPEDEDFAELLARRCRKRGLDTVEFPKHRMPSALNDALASLFCFVGVGMHRLIGACSFGVPVFFLAWDAKVLAFMRSIGREDCHFSVDEHRPSEVAGKVVACGPDVPRSTQMARVVDEGMQGIRSLCTSISRELVAGS